MKFDKTSGKRTALCSLIALILLFIDQFSKLLAHYFLEENATYETSAVPVIPGFLTLRYTGNQGIAFGLGMDSKPFMIAVMVFTALLIILIIFLVYAVFRGNFPVRMSLAIVEAGAIGNFLDRLFFYEDGVATVRDFLDFSAFRPLKWLGSDFNFGICNFADLCITAGAIALVFIVMFIGPRAVFPLKKAWREESKREEEEHEKQRAERKKAQMGSQNVAAGSQETAQAGSPEEPEAKPREDETEETAPEDGR